MTEVTEVQKQKTQEIIEKLIYNRENPIIWIKDNVKIKHPAFGVIPFNLYDFQEKIIKLFLLRHFVITLKSRQVGMSTLVQSICLWSAMHYSNFNVLILSAGQRNASSFLEKIRSMYDFLPDNELKLKLSTDNKQTLIFSNGSKIVAIPATRSASLGESINLLIIDEAGFIERVEEVYQASYPTISRAFKSSKGKPFGIIIISTPNGISGVGRWYYEMYDGALQKLNKYVPVKIHWSLIPEYDKAWYLDQCSQLNWNFRSISAELELSFVSSGNTYIPGQILDSIGISEPIEKAKDDHFWVWEQPVKGKVYVAGVDVAYGDKKDSSTIQILDAVTLEQVAEYESNTIIIDDFADIIIGITKMYNNALTNIERNAVGKVLIEKIIRKTDGGIGMNLYRDINPNDLENKILTKEIFLSYIGTNVTSASRDILLANMYSIILDKYTESLDNIISEEDDKANARTKFELLMEGKTENAIKKYGIIKSERLYHQLLGFVVNEHGKPMGLKDDLVMGWVHALYCWTKSKAFLLKDIAKIMSETFAVNDTKRNQLETIKFIKNHSEGSSVWQNTTPEDIQKFLDEENYTNNKINNEEAEASSIAKIYKAFYS